VTYSPGTTALLAASASNNESGTGDEQQRVSISIQQLLSYMARGGTAGSALVFLPSCIVLTQAPAPVIDQDEEGDSDEDDDYLPGDGEDDDDYDDDDEEDDDELQFTRWGQRNFNSVAQYFPPAVSQEAGLKLLYSGEFGPPPAGPVVNIQQTPKKPQSRRAARRAQRSPVPQSSKPIENLVYPSHDSTYRVPSSPIRTPYASHYYRVEAARGLVPNSPGAIVAQYEDRVYSGQFSLDASIFYSCTQGHDVWVYDANSSGEKRVDPASRHGSRMKLLNRVKGVYGNWTITDSHLSPDNERYVLGPNLSALLTINPN
jgi:hypothetical protein